VGGEQLLEGAGVLRHAVTFLQILVEERHGIVRQADEGDFGAGGAGAGGGDADQPLVERLGPGASREGKDSGHGGVLRLDSLYCIAKIRCLSPCPISHQHFAGGAVSVLAPGGTARYH